MAHARRWCALARWAGAGVCVALRGPMEFDPSIVCDRINIKPHDGGVSISLSPRLSRIRLFSERSVRNVVWKLTVNSSFLGAHGCAALPLVAAR